jgi:hypothetical protein
MAKLRSDAQILVINIPQQLSGTARISYERI